MPRKSRLNLPPLKLGKETLGKRIARLRKEKGLSQIELANEIGIIQSIVSEYERDNLRLPSEMAIRFSMALGVSTDELLGLKTTKNGKGNTSLKVLKRINKIETLPQAQQKILLKTIDAFLKGVGAT